MILMSFEESQLLNFTSAFGLVTDKYYPNLKNLTIEEICILIPMINFKGSNKMIGYQEIFHKSILPPAVLIDRLITTILK